jgi:hypothetical protein
MPTSFSFEHVFRCAGPEVLLAGYFDPDRVRHQDAATGIAAREVLELTDTEPATTKSEPPYRWPDGPDSRPGRSVVRRVCRVTPSRQLPAFLRPFVRSGLDYVEEAEWRRGEPQIALRIRPSLLRGRAEVTATYRLQPEAPGQVRRIYAGQVTVELPVIGGRVERGIVADLEKSLTVAARCTQDYLDAGPDRGSSTGSTSVLESGT